MNKIFSVISMSALCLGFAACDDVPESLSKPQTNPQEPIFDATNFSVTPTTEQLDLESLFENGQLAKVATYTVSGLPDGYSVGMEMQISADQDFTDPVTVPVKIDAETSSGYVDAMVLDKAYYNNVSHKSDAATVYVRFVGEAVKGSEVVRLGGINVYYGNAQMQIAPFKVAETYKLEGTASADFEASKEGIDDNPQFEIIVEVSAAEAENGFVWYVEAPDGRKYGPEYSSDQRGKLVLWTGSNEYKGVIHEMGPYIIKANMRTRTYEIALAIPMLYTPGDTNGWSQPASQTLTTTDYKRYSGFAHLNGAFKFSSQPDWNGINFGKGEKEGELSTAGTADNLSVAEDGLYQCTVDIPNLSYTIKHINLVGAIGSMTGWGSDIALEPSADFLTWSAVIDFNAGDEWKIRFNEDWGANLGGSYDDMVQDGANLKVDESGTYQVTLNLATHPYFVTMTKQ